MFLGKKLEVKAGKGGKTGGPVQLGTKEVPTKKCSIIVFS